MDETNDVSTLPVNLEASLDPGLLPEITFRNTTHMMEGHQVDSPSSVNKSSNGRLSPVRGRTIKEYDQQISDLKKENFNLKMRIFYMEERIQQRYGDGQDVYKTNIELQVQTEKLKKDLADKQILLQKASTAMETLTANHKQAEELLKAQIFTQVKDEVKLLQAQLEESKMECDRIKNEEKNVVKKLYSLQEDLNSALADLRDSNDEKTDLSNKLKSAELDVQHLTGQIRLADQAKAEKEKENNTLHQLLKDMKIQLQDSQKEISRKDRDMQNLTSVLQNESHVDSQSILEPVHQQDEIEDAREIINRKDEKIGTLEDQLQGKEKTLSDLEKTLHEAMQKLEDNERAKQDLEKGLQQDHKKLEKYKLSLEDCLKTHAKMESELKSKQAKLSEAEDSIKKLEQALKDAEVEKSKVLDEFARKVSDLEMDNRRLKCQLTEAEAGIENLVMSLGKKEGELVGSQEQLQKAIDALTDSDKALDALREQLQAERADFDKRLQEEVFKQKGEAPQDIMTDLKELLDELRKEMLSLASLHHLSIEIHKTGDPSSSAEVLLTEISSVQKICKQLEAGVEKNSQLHKALLSSLKGEQKQADSPDSSSCQDGGHYVSPTYQLSSKLSQAHTPTRQHLGHLDVETGLVDRSFQAGTSLNQRDQWAQTSQYCDNNVADHASNTSITSAAAELGNPIKGGRLHFLPQSSWNSSDLPTAVPATTSGQRVRPSHVHFAESASLTDLGKDLIHPNIDDHSNNSFSFRHGPIFDEDNFDLRTHDRASSVRPDSRATTQLTYDDSENAAVPSSSAANSPTSSACNAIIDGPLPIPLAKQDSNSSKLRASPKAKEDKYHTEIQIPLDQHSFSHATDEVKALYCNSNHLSDINNHRSTSFVSVNGSDELVGKVKRSPASYELNKVASGTADKVFEKEKTDLEPQFEDQEAQRSRRNSWAEELEQYKVHGRDDTGNQHQRDINVQKTDQTPQQQQQFIVLASMSTVELRDLVAQLQVDLVDAIKQNKALQNELRAVNNKTPVVNGPTNLRSSLNKSKIPVAQSSNSCHSTTSDDSDYVDGTGRPDNRRVMFNMCNGHKKQQNGHVSSFSLDRKTSNDASLQSKLSESTRQIQLLQNKLQATENTVRLLSKKNKTYVAALESAGVSSTFLNRSSSESCLASFPKASRTASTSCLDSTGMSRGLTHFLSPIKGRDLSSMEQSRNPSLPRSTLDSHAFNMSPPSKMVQSSSSSSTTSYSPHKSHSSSSIASGQQQTKYTSRSPTGPAATSPKYQMSMHDSRVDASIFPDVTYTSMLDGTMLNKLQSIGNFDNTLSTTIPEDTSSLTIDQLHGRLEHLERINLTLREEISVYETMYQTKRTQATQVSHLSSSDGGAGGDSDDDILKQHLEEIKKLRQRLERLDITKDPEQLLIFQSHTQQRIARQESMLAHLQQQMAEKEEQHNRECAQLQHSLTRDKAALAESMKQTISDLRRQIESQDNELKDRVQEVDELRMQLTQALERERKQEAVEKKILAEKTELEDDLIKRDKEFLELEKMMFKLEMAKESCDSDMRRMKIETDEKQKESVKLKSELEDYKENSKCLKEIIVKRERTLQEKIQSLQKVSNEKAVIEQHMNDKDEKLTRLEEDLSNLKIVMRDAVQTHEMEKSQLESQLQELKSNLKRRDSMEARNALEAAELEAKLTLLEEQKSELMTAQKKELGRVIQEKNLEMLEVKRQVDGLRQKVKDKDDLELEVQRLREKLRATAELQSKVEKLEYKLNQKTAVEAELREKVDSLNCYEVEVRSFEEKLESNSELLRMAREEANKAQQELKEREEKLKKRDKQLKNLISQHLKLEATFTKQKNSLRERNEQLQSQKKQLRLFEVSLTCSSQEEKEDIMKQLIKELIATQRQVEELLSRLEQNPINHPSVRVETYGAGSTVSTTTVTTAVSRASSTSSGQDNVDTALSDIRDSSPERCLGASSNNCMEKDLDMVPSSIIGPHSPVPSLGPSTPLRPISTNQSLEHSLSPRHFRYYNDKPDFFTSGTIPEGVVDSDVRSLFAVHKLESHEKVRKEASEALVILSNIESRLNDSLRIYKEKHISESLDYSTMRETSFSCQNLRICLEEAIKLTATAWITELPPVDVRGHFYDPILAEQNENLKRDLTVLKSRYDILDHTVKEQQGRLLATSEHHKNWEQSLYKQLHKTAGDMEQAKENFEAAGFVPQRKSLKMRSPTKTSHKMHDDII